MTSAWLESYGDVNRYDFLLNRPILMDGFVHTAENFAKLGEGDGEFTDLQGKRAMGYYDQDILNYYYYMAANSRFPIAGSRPFRARARPTASRPTQEEQPRVWYAIPTWTTSSPINWIFKPSSRILDQNGVSWKVYYSLTEGGCTDKDGDCGQGGHSSDYPVTTFSDFAFSAKFLYSNPNHEACIPPTIGSKQAVGDPDECLLHRYQPHRSARTILQRTRRTTHCPAMPTSKQLTGTATSTPVPDSPSSTASNRSHPSSTR